MQDDGRSAENEDPALFTKPFEAFFETWGDGGRGDFTYPIYVAEPLRVDRGVRAQLVRQFRAMNSNANVQDIQPNGIVHDILDPSLHARLLDEKELEAFLHQTKLNEEERQWCGPCFEDSQEEFYLDSQEEDSQEDDSQEDDVNRLRKAHEETGQLRGSFQWIPTLVHCELDSLKDERKATIVSDIPGLPERCAATENVYQLLEKALTAMLPLFAQLDLADEWECTYRRGDGDIPHPILQQREKANSNDNSKLLQVVLKVQEYVLPPNSSYTGRWHTEGFSENIVAAGVYYLDVSEETTGGELSFRPKGTPDEDYYEYVREDNAGDFWHNYIRDVPVRLGTAVVFHNSIPHRFKSIHNTTDRPQRRLFLNVFVVDPATPLPVSSCVPFLRRVLARHNVGERNLQNKILGFAGGSAEPSILRRKVLRDKARAAMSKDRPRWYTINYGNCGKVQYHGDSRAIYGGYSFHKPHEYRNYEGLEHSGCPSSALGSGC